MNDLSKNELVTALILGLIQMDNPPGFKWDDERSTEDRDTARRLSAHIIDLVPDLDELASICVGIWVKHDPRIIKEGRNWYAGPDVFRTREVEAGRYPDDSGWTDDDDDADFQTWAERNGRKLHEDAFEAKALLELRRIQDRQKSERATASRQRRQEKARRQKVIAGMLQAATVTASDTMH